MIKLILLFLTSLLLLGCAYSVERLEADQDLRHKVLAKCVTKGTEAINDTNCKNAAEAEAKVTGKAVKSFFEKL